jgi:hypothetical protein
MAQARLDVGHDVLRRDPTGHHGGRHPGGWSAACTRATNPRTNDRAPYRANLSASASALMSSAIRWMVQVCGGCDPTGPGCAYPSKQKLVAQRIEVVGELVMIKADRRAPR